MKILFIASHIPINNGSGGVIRSYQLCADLAAFAEVHILTTTPYKDAPPVVEILSNLKYVGHITAPWEASWRKRQCETPIELTSILSAGNYDFIVVRYYGAAAALGLFGHKNLIVDCDDCALEVRKQNLFVRSLKESVKNLIIYNVFKRNYIKNLQTTLYALFAKRSGVSRWQENYKVIPNRISLPAKSSVSDKNSKQSSASILFVGNLAYSPNCTGLDYFLANVWPLVIQTKPQAHLKIVGGGLSVDYQRAWSTIKNITLCGFVDDIESAYNNTLFSIAPVYAGSGTHIKILESLIHKKTLVISSLAHRGYEETLLSGESLLVADSAEEFAEHIRKLVDSSVLRDSLAEQGYEVVKAKFTLNPEKSVLRELLHRP